jgi:hypothetical protein
MSCELPNTCQKKGDARYARGLRKAIDKGIQKMKTFEATISIRRPLTEVFAFVLDVWNLPLYNPMVREVRGVTGRPEELGSTVITVTNILGKERELTWETTAYQLNKELASKTIAGPLKLEIKTTFHAIADGTKVQALFSGQLPKLLLPLVRRQHQTSVESMRTILEGHEPQR